VRFEQGKVGTWRPSREIPREGTLRGKNELPRIHPEGEKGPGHVPGDGGEEEDALIKDQGKKKSRKNASA